MSAGNGFFIDSNVLLYSVDPVESGERLRAKEWLEAMDVWSRSIELAGSPRVLLECGEENGTRTDSGEGDRRR